MIRNGWKTRYCQYIRKTGLILVGFLKKEAQPAEETIHRSRKKRLKKKDFSSSLLSLGFHNLALIFNTSIWSLRAKEEKLLKTDTLHLP